MLCNPSQYMFPPLSNGTLAIWNKFHIFTSVFPALNWLFENSQRVGDALTNISRWQFVTQGVSPFIAVNENTLKHVMWVRYSRLGGGPRKAGTTGWPMCQDLPPPPAARRHDPAAEKLGHGQCRWFGESITKLSSCCSHDAYLIFVIFGTPPHF